MAHGIVSVYGMTDAIGNVSYVDRTGEYQFKKQYSEQTAQLIDAEVRSIIESAYKRTKVLLLEKRDELEKVAKELLEKEVIFKADLEKLIGERPIDVLNRVV